LATACNPSAIRCRLLRTLQVQSAPHRRLRPSVRLFARSVPAARRGGHGLHRRVQIALLRQPQDDQSDRHRAARASAGFLAPAWPRRLAWSALTSLPLGGVCFRALELQAWGAERPRGSVMANPKHGDDIVLIAGGGIGGLATALTLHQVGIPSVVLEGVR